MQGWVSVVSTPQRCFIVKSCTCCIVTLIATECCQHLFLCAGHSRSPVVARASEEAPSRRAIIGGVLAAVAAVSVPQADAAGVDIMDGTKLREQGFDIIYEARDLDLPQVHYTLLLFRARMDVWCKYMYSQTST